MQVIIYIFIVHLILPVPTFVIQQIGNKFCEGKFNSTRYMHHKSTLSKEYQKDWYCGISRQFIGLLNFLAMFECFFLNFEGLFAISQSLHSFISAYICILKELLHALYWSNASRFAISVFM